MYILSALIGYLLGNLNTAIIISKLIYKKDIRNFGSGNAGTANTLRSFGKGMAIIVLAGDMLKGAAAVMIAKRLAEPSKESLPCILIAGAFVVIGHVFPVFFGFKGGKGVATAAAVILTIEPVLFLILIFFYVLILIIFKYVSLASISSAILYPILTFAVLYFSKRPFIFESLFASAIGALIVFTHRSNISKLIKGAENKISLAGNKDNQTNT